MPIQGVQEHYPDGIETVGVVKRISFHCLVYYIDGSKEWHYFGSTAAEKPPTTGDPVFEHPYIQFPQGLDDLNTDEAEDILYDAGRMVGFRREGIE